MSKKHLLAGLIGIFIVALLTTVLRSLNFWMFPNLLGLFIAVGFAIVFTEINYISSFIIFLLLASTSLTITFDQIYNVMGRNTSPVAVSQIPSSRLYATYHFPDAKILTEKIGSTDVYSSWRTLSTNLGKVYVAPLVDTNWKTGDPIPAWVVTSLNDINYERERWHSPYNAGARLVGGWISGYGDLETYRQAINEDTHYYGLTTPENAPILRWVSDPQSEIQTERVLYLKITGLAMILWLFTFFLHQLFRKKKI